MLPRALREDPRLVPSGGLLTYYYLLYSRHTRCLEGSMRRQTS